MKAVGERQLTELAGRSDAFGVSRLSAVDERESHSELPYSSTTAQEVIVSVQGQSPGGLESAFYRELLFQLGEHAQRGGTAYGAAAVAKRVAVAYGVDGAVHLPLPRPTRLEREAVADREFRG